MAADDPILFSLDSGRDFAARVAAALGVEPGRHEERDFGDGEHKIRSLESVRDRDVFVIQSLSGDRDYSLNDQLVRLLFLLGALRENAPRRLTAVVPYLCYSRKDRKTKSRDPVTTRYVAQLFEAMGVDTVVTLDVHNRAAFDNAFRCHTSERPGRADGNTVAGAGRQGSDRGFAGCGGREAGRAVPPGPGAPSGSLRGQRLYGKTP